MEWIKWLVALSQGLLLTKSTNQKKSFLKGQKKSNEVDSILSSTQPKLDRNF